MFDFLGDYHRSGCHFFDSLAVKSRRRKSDKRGRRRSDHEIEFVTLETAMFASTSLSRALSFETLDFLVRNSGYMCPPTPNCREGHKFSPQTLTDIRFCVDEQVSLTTSSKNISVLKAH
jgi:hypothetical protein